MKTESTIETIAVVTPNCAIARRSQTSSYNTLQKPEKRKKKKYQFTNDSLARARFQFHNPVPSAHVECREVPETRQGRCNLESLSGASQATPCQNSPRGSERTNTGTPVRPGARDVCK